MAGGKQPRRPGQSGKPGRAITADDPRYQHGIMTGVHSHEIAGHHELGQVDHRHDHDNDHEGKYDVDRNADGNNALAAHHPYGPAVEASKKRMFASIQDKAQGVRGA